MLWLLGSLSRQYRIPFAPKLVEQDFPLSHSLATFHEAARALGFKSGHSAHSADWQKLPLPYFEHRPTGTLVARLNGVETIREFVSGAAEGTYIGGDRKTLIDARFYRTFHGNDMAWGGYNEMSSTSLAPGKNGQKRNVYGPLGRDFSEGGEDLHNRQAANDWNGRVRA